jgi:cytochrome c peroxidase
MIKKCIVLAVVAVIAATGLAVARDNMLSPMEQLGKELFFDWDLPAPSRR